MPDPLTPFKDPLEPPPLLRPVRVARDGTRFYRVTMRPGKRRFHSQLKKAGEFWGYDGLFPGPTFEVPTGTPVVVEWANQLKGPYPFSTEPDDSGTDHSEHQRSHTEHRTVVHLHGSPTLPDYDGWSDNVFGPGESLVYRYPGYERGVLLWYHDHANMITRLNVFAGLAGLYLIRSGEERAAGLPTRWPYEIPLLIQDRKLEVNEDRYTGRLRYGPLDQHDAFTGDHILVNGTIWPHVEVRPRAYRLRLLNGSNGRIYKLRLVPSDESGTAPVLTQIGSDMGFLMKPAPVDPAVGLSLAPAERADVLVDFRDHAGKSLRLVDRDPDTPVIEFRVAQGRKGKPLSMDRIPWAGPAQDPQQATQTRPLFLLRDAQDRHTINGRLFHEAIDEKPYLDALEVWEFFNLTGDQHPMHVHLIDFRVINRQEVVDDLAGSTDPGQTLLERVRRWLDQPPPKTPLPDGLRLEGPILDPAPAELGPKDTALARSGHVTRVIARFGPHPGRYMYHCHILEHEDMDMMRPFVVIPHGLGHPGDSHGTSQYVQSTESERSAGWGRSSASVRSSGNAPVGAGGSR
jgi:spore coat protein A